MTGDTPSDSGHPTEGSPVARHIAREPGVPPLAPDHARRLTEIVFLPETVPQPADALFVFGGTHPRQWQTALEAYRRGLGGVLVVTGGHDPGGGQHPCWRYGDEPQAHVIARHLVEGGVPRSAVLVEDRSTNTLENVLFARNVFDFSRVASLVFIGKSHAAGRQYRTLRRHLPGLVHCWPFTFNAEHQGAVIGRHNWMRTDVGRRRVWGEYVRILVYGRRGDIEPLTQPIEDLDPYVAPYLDHPAG